VRQPRERASCRWRGCERPRSRHRGIAWVRSPRVCRGPRSAWEAWRDASSTWEALEGPGRYRQRRGKRAPGIRIRSHGRGNPDTEVGRSLNGVERAAARASREADPSEQGQPTASRESAPPLGLGGRESRPQGEGADRQTEPAQDTWTGHEGSETPGTPPCRVEQRRPQATRSSGVATSMGGSTRHG